MICSFLNLNYACLHGMLHTRTAPCELCFVFRKTAQGLGHKIVVLRAFCMREPPTSPNSHCCEYALRGGHVGNVLRPCWCTVSDCLDLCVSSQVSLSGQCRLIGLQWAALFIFLP